MKENQNSDKINKSKCESQINNNLVDGGNESGLQLIYVSFELCEVLCESMVEKVVSIIKRNESGIIDFKI